MGSESKEPEAGIDVEPANCRGMLIDALILGDVARFNTLRNQNPNTRPTFYSINAALSGRSLAGINMSHCVLRRMRFNGLNLTDADFSNTIFQECSFDEAVLHGAKFDEASFDRSMKLNMIPMSLKQVLQLKREPSPSLGDQFRQAAEPLNAVPIRMDGDGDVDEDVDDELNLESPESITPASPPSHTPISPPSPSLTEPNEQASIASTPQPPQSMQQQIADKAKSVAHLVLTEAEEGAFRGIVELGVESGRDGIIALIDQVTPLDASTRKKVTDFFNTEAGKGLVAIVTSGLLESPLLEMVPGISPRVVRFIRERVVVEIRTGSVWKPATKAALKLLLSGPLKQLFDTLAMFTTTIERRMDTGAEHEPSRLSEPVQTITDFNMPPVAVPASFNPFAND